MIIHRAYRTEIDPTCKQVRLLLQHAGCARWAYNWGLKKKIDAYKSTGKSPTAIDLHRELNALKKLPIEEGGTPWMYESSKCAPQEALRNLDTAFKNFFRRCKEGAGKKGFPQFKSRKNGIGSFRLTGAVRAFKDRVRLPAIGSIRLKEHGYLPTEGVKILSATISEAAGRWFVSLQVEQEVPDPARKRRHVVGVDVGIHRLAVTSDGDFFENPRALRRSQRLLRIRQKAVSRKAKGSANRRKAVAYVARTHQRVANIRRDAIHKMTTSIAKTATTLVIEDLNVSGMLKNHKLAKSISDAAFGEIHRQLEYKSKWSGDVVVKAPRFYPSSKKCSRCGAIHECLKLSDRTYRCPRCGLVIDRDLNAAINLKKYAASSAVLACRPGGAGPGRKTRAKPLVGQEPRRIKN